MAKVSRESASQVQDFGAGEDRSEDLGGYRVSFVSIREDQDLAPMLSKLPDGHCVCPHWGYLTKGQITVRYADHEEVIHAGEAFYFPPGHAPAATAGTEIVQFSPTKEFAEFEAALSKVMQQMQGA